MIFCYAPLPTNGYAESDTHEQHYNAHFHEMYDITGITSPILIGSVSGNIIHTRVDTRANLIPKCT